MPQVSIITPVYNAAQFLSETLASVQAQTMPDWEQIMVDDGSTDGSIDLIEKAAAEDPRIRLLRTPQNGGPAAARNLAIGAARGRYIAFLDADDLWKPEKLQVQLMFMQEHQAGFTYTSYRRFSGAGYSEPVKIRERVDYRDLLGGNAMACLTVMIDREKFPNIWMPPAKFDDYAAWLRLLRKGGEALGIREDLASYRVNSGSFSGNKFRSALWTWQVYREQERLALVRSLWNFAWYAGRNITRRLVERSELTQR